MVLINIYAFLRDDHHDYNISIRNAWWIGGIVNVRCMCNMSLPMERKKVLI